jgi:hypothetical protein
MIMFTYLYTCMHKHERTHGHGRRHRVVINLGARMWLGCGREMGIVMDRHRHMAIGHMTIGHICTKK